MNIDIVSMDHNGNGIGKIDNKIIFVPKSVVGDKIDVSILKNYKKYDIGKIEKIISKSDKRVDAICPYYQECGGCNISNLSYCGQLDFKKDKVKNMFKKYLNMDIDPEIISSDNEYKYRNKITYHNKTDIGLIDIYGKIISIDECLLVSDKINKLYKKIKLEDLSEVKMIMIKECDNGLILSIYGKLEIDKFKDDCISIYIDDKCVYLKEDGFINLSGINYRVSNKSFFQINTCNIEKLYNLILKYGDFNKSDKVIDLYCGVGSISLYIAKYVDSVYGIEIVLDAIKDAKENAKRNKINNVKFLCSDVSKICEDEIEGNVIIVDPPRTGLDKHTIDVINKKSVEKLIYVSCDPMTLVRDIKLLDKYQFKDITLVDMFPQTHHVECVSVLYRKKI